MRIKLIFKNPGECAGGSCPTVYETDKNSYLLQGYMVKENLIDLPDGETLIELPKEFLDSFIKSHLK